MLLGPRSIAWLGHRFREPIKSDSPEVERLHAGKNATPTMGGLFIFAGISGSVLLAGDLSNRYLLLGLALAAGLALLGAIDDLVKLYSRRPGLSRRGKLAGQLVLTVSVAASPYTSITQSSPMGWSCRRRGTRPPRSACGSSRWPFW